MKAGTCCKKVITDMDSSLVTGNSTMRMEGLNTVGIMKMESGLESGSGTTGKGTGSLGNTRILFSGGKRIHALFQR